MPPRSSSPETLHPFRILERVQGILGERFDLDAYERYLTGVLDGGQAQLTDISMPEIERQLSFDGFPEGFAPHFYKRSVDDIQGGIRPTRTEALGHIEDRMVFDKREDTHGYVRSFKARGALFDMLSTLSRTPSVRTFTANSTGNHARGVVAAVNMFNDALVSCGAVRVNQYGEVVQEDASQLFRAVIYTTCDLESGKRQAIDAGGAQILDSFVELGEGGRAAKEAAELAPQHVAYVDPYDTDSIITGQATLGLELLVDLASQGVDLRATPVILRVAVGGGGMYAGQAAVFERAIARGLLHADSRVIAVEAEGNDSANREIRRQPPLTAATLSTVAGGIATLQSGRRGVAVVGRLSPDGVRVVNEGHMLRAANILAAAHDGVPPEFAGTLSLASLLRDADEGYLRDDGGVEVTITCGGNASSDLLYEAVQKGRAHEDARVQTAAIHLGPGAFKLVSNEALQPVPQPVVISPEAIRPVLDISVAEYVRTRLVAAESFSRARGQMDIVSRPFV